MAKKLWKTKTADNKFSQFVRDRDGKCMRCGKSGDSFRLECSHFFTRAISIVRYDPENCIALCHPCHAGNSRGWEYQKQSAYRDFMIYWLGVDRYEKLVKRSNKILSRRKAIIKFMEYYAEHDSNNKNCECKLCKPTL